MTEKKKSVILIGLLATAGLVFYLDKNDSVGIPRTGVSAPFYTPLAVDSLALRQDKLESSRKTEYQSSGRDLFTEAIAPVRPRPKVPDPIPSGPVGPQPLPPPPPPVVPKLPANLKYFGYGTIPNGTLKKAFLTDGEGVFIVGEGDTLLGRYRIVRIGPRLDFEEISSGMRGSAPLEEQSAPPA
jgi:hypothetical protein